MGTDFVLPFRRTNMNNSTIRTWNRLDGPARRLVCALAERWDCEAGAVLAVIEIESGGRITARVNGRDEPVIRFEGHVFDRLLPASHRARARAAGLAHPKAGRVRNPRSQGARWRLLDRAIAIDRIAALSATSWGLGQVMGFNWRALSYGSVDALVAEARDGARGQIALMARFVDHAGLASALKARDWRRFARRYNGPAYARHGYHTKLAAAHARAQRIDMGEQTHEPLPAPDSDGLAFGARGSRVRMLQQALNREGAALTVDGVFGLRTDRALRRWQRGRGRTVTGTISLGDAWHLFGPATVLRDLASRFFSAFTASAAG